jgi:hypothetical protein
VSLRTALLSLLGRGGERELDPDEYVDVVNVELWRSQLVVVALRERGVPAVALESSTIPYAPLTRARIQVPRHDLVRAMSIIDGLDAT